MNDELQTAAPDLCAFYAANGRLPYITDEVKPWQYRGFLLPYVIELHGNPLFGKPTEHLESLGIDPAEVPQALRDRGKGHCPDRWGYHLRTLAAGALLDEEIPQITFLSEADQLVRSQIENQRAGIGAWMRLIADNDRYGWDNFAQLIDWFSFALGVEKAEPKLGDKTNEALYRGVNVEHMLLHPADYFGQFLAITKASGWNPDAFYPTPMHVCEFITRMTMSESRKVLEDGRDPRTASVCDPCVGSGRFLMTASNLSMNLYGMDINPMVVKITKINGALYAPWMSFPLPASILGARVPDPPPAPLPVNPTNDGPQFRVDDKGQGVLFQ